MTAYVPIDCTHYDYMEIMCMDRYHVEIDGDDVTIRGKAITTESNEEGEFLVFEFDDGARDAIRMDNIRKITILSEPRRFDELTLKD